MWMVVDYFLFYFWLIFINRLLFGGWLIKSKRENPFTTFDVFGIGVLSLLVYTYIFKHKQDSFIIPLEYIVTNAS